MNLSRALVLVLVAGASTAPGGAAGTASSDATLAAPSFRPAPGWWTVRTGPATRDGAAPQAWAVTVRSADALVPFDLARGLRRLRSGGVLIWATTAGRGGPLGVFERAPWPLRLARFRVDRTWEGQPITRIQRRLTWAAARGWRLDVRVFFGTQRPSRHLLATAQAQLDRLLLPSSR